LKSTENCSHSTVTVTENQREDCSSQSEVIRRSVGPSSSRVVGAYRERRQLRWSATDRHLLYINTPAYGSGW